MKKLLMLFCAGVLIGALCAGCSEFGQDQQQPPQTGEGAEINPVPVSKVSDEVAAFFNEHLPSISGGVYSDCFFVNDNENKCLIINSDKELQAIIHSSVELPAIDFDKYTLIIGQHRFPKTSFYVLSQNIDVGSDRITLNLSVKVPESSYQAFSTLYFWAIYPKLSKIQINVNVIYKK